MKKPSTIAVSWLLLLEWQIILPMVASFDFGWQSGPGGSSYAAAAVYDAVNQTLRITGATYVANGDASASTTINCFLATIPLKEDAIDQPQVFASESSEACTCLAMQGDKVYLAGYKEAATTTISGILAEASPVVSETNFTEQNIFPISTIPVVYPVALTASRVGDLERFFVVSRNTDDTSRNNYPGEVNPTRIFPYGSKAFSMSVHRIQRQVTAMAYTLQSARVTYSATANGAPVSIFASGIAYLREDLLIVVGSTAGQGGFLGNKKVYGEDLDGFVTKLNATSHDGSLYGDGTGVVRIESVNQREDLLMGLCYTELDPDHIYLVGNTAGQLEGAAAGSNNTDTTDAFLIKMNVDTLSVVWTIQLGAVGTGNVTGAACAVTPDAQAVWFGGIVYNGAVVVNADVPKSFGGKDIFVAKVVDGSLEFVRQMGTDLDDILAWQGGGLTVDLDGNAIVTGHTYGSWFRSREEKGSGANIFVTTVSLDASAVTNPAVSASSPTSGSPPVSAPVQESPMTTTEQATTKPTSPNAVFVPLEADVSPLASGSYRVKGGLMWLSIFVLSFSLF